MARYFLELAYMGTRYSGFQVQANQVTIQSEVEKALQTVYRESFVLTGSSRTDTGVHAIQNYFHFDTELLLQADQLYNLNAVLPSDIAVKGIFRVPDEAHCRFDALAREYEYQIYNHKNPFLVDRGWRYPFPVQLEKLQLMAALLLEYRDYTSFAKRNSQVKTFLCTLESSAWREEEGRLFYRVKANRFLRGMVRGLVGTMLQAARTGGGGVEEIRRILDAKDVTQADFNTPAQGLFLVSVTYPDGLMQQI